MRILGLDLGSTSIKAVEIDSAFGRYDIHDYHELAIPAGADPVELLGNFLHGLPKSPDKVAVALRSGHVTFRNLQLPIRDKKAIQASVGFELEDELPFPLEQAIYDYSVMSQTRAGTYLHVAASLKKHVATSLAFWTAAGADPDVLTTEAWAFRALLNRTLSVQAQEEPALLAHIGHEKTTL
ncbi:MAG: pilus assembly protein PilM, partial [Bdellovibrionota bacterium]